MTSPAFKISRGLWLARNNIMKKIVCLGGFCALIISSDAFAAPLELFGTPLWNATRSTLEPALQKAGLTPRQIGSKWWFDIYGVSGQMPGANKLLVGYTEHNQFAVAQYVFPSFMNTELVEKVIQMVEDKYGAPTHQSGSVDLGTVTATWDESNGMSIRVSRGWPSTTTYLNLENRANYARMQAQMRAQKAAHQAQQAQAHGNAF